MQRPSGETLSALACILVGGIVAAVLAPRDADFAPNFLFFWLPQGAIVAVVGLLRSRPAVIAGVALALAIYLAGFGAWILTRRHPESMAWLGYLFSLPGATLAAIGVALWQKGRVVSRPVRAGLFATLAVLAGVAANQAIICNTVMYCRGK